MVHSLTSITHKQTSPPWDPGKFNLNSFRSKGHSANVLCLKGINNRAADLRCCS